MRETERGCEDIRKCYHVRTGKEREESIDMNADMSANINMRDRVR